MFNELREPTENKEILSGLHNVGTFGDFRGTCTVFRSADGHEALPTPKIDCVIGSVLSGATK
jgi:hypothetical protein